MKIILLVSLFGVALSARLDNTYLPPAGAGGSGGYQRAGFGGAPSRSGGGGGGGSRTGGGAGGGSGSYSGGGSGSYSGGGGGGSGKEIPILRYESENDGYGNYQYAYETGNGITAQEKGTLKNAGSQNEAESATGSFSYTGPDGQKYTIQYTADENGFQAVGAHLPTPPPIPEEILRSIELNKASGDSDDEGQYKASPGPSQSFSPQTGYNY